MKKIPCEIYSRVVGYFRPVQNWNRGKQAEFADRLAYNVSVSMSHGLPVAADHVEELQTVHAA